MQLLKEVCDMTLVSEDNERIDHTRWFWRLWVPLQGLYYDDKIHTMKLCVLKDFFLQNSWYLRVIWFTMQSWWQLKDIMEISWKSKEVTDFIMGKTNKIRCSFYNQGIYKSGPGWLFDYTYMYSETHMREKSCRNCSNTE